VTISDSISQTPKVKKRPRTFSGSDRSLKRQRKAIPDIQQIAKVFTECDYQKMGENKVWVTKQLFDRIYPKSEIEDHQYIKVAHYIYELGGLIDMKGHQIGVNEVQHLDLQDYLCPPNKLDSLQIRPYREEDINYREIKHMVFNIQPYGYLQYQGRKKGAVKLSVEELRATIGNQFLHQLLEMGQRVFLNHSEGPMMIKVMERTYGEDPFEELRNGTEVPRYGIITSDTVIDFQTSSLNIDLVQEQDLSEVKRYHFQIVKVNDVSQRIISSGGTFGLASDAWKKGSKPIPLSITNDSFFREVRKAFDDTLISTGHIEEIHFDRNWVLRVKFTKVELNDGILVDDDDRYYYEKNYEKTFKVQDHHAITVDPGSRCILTTEDEHARKADRMKFVIVGWEISRVLAPNEKITVSVEDLEGFIRNSDSFQPIKGRLVAEIGNDKFLLELENATGTPAKEPHAKGNIKDVWAFDENTDIRLRSKKKGTINLVDKSEPVIVEKLTVKVEKAPSGGGLLAMLMGGGAGEDKKIIEEKELRELFHENAPKQLLKKHAFRATTSEGDDVIFTCENFEFPDKGKEIITHGLLYEINEDTKIVIDSEKDSEIIIQTESEIIEYDKIPQHLKDLGVGGLPHRCYSFIRDMLLSRGEYAEVFRRVKIRPERGVIIYGPPGTGKTLIARNIGKMIGATEGRINIISGSDLLDKYVGETERKIRELYQPARDAYEKFGDKSPTFVVGIDEGETILGSRKTADRRYQQGHTNAFLAVIDGISGKSGESLPNVVTIVLTNYIENIDDAAKRPGRLGTHIEIGIPNADGRRDIFEIYTKHLIKEGLMSEEALDWLVQRTPGKTGAFIEGMVQKAFQLPVGRLAEGKVPGKEAFDSPLIKLGRGDFERAYAETLNTDIGKDCMDQISIPKKVQFSGISQQLKKLGLVGIPGRLLGVLQDIVLTRFTYKEEMAQVGYQAPRGMFLYGPSGTGKSTFVRALPQLLGLDSDRFAIYSASDLWQRWNGNMKDELKKMFEPAIQASKDLKENSDLFVVVIEDIDRLFKATKRSKTYESSIMNDFLSEIDTAFNEKISEILHGRGSIKIGNLLVVATMTTSQELHPDLIGYGQQGIHVEMPLPTHKGRAEIFKHYLEPYHKDGRLAEDVDFTRLANLTEKRSGEYIQGAVTKAATYPLIRAELARLLDEVGFYDKVTFDIDVVDPMKKLEIKRLAGVSEFAKDSYLLKTIKHVPKPISIASGSSSDSLIVEKGNEILASIEPITQDDLEKAIMEVNTDKFREQRRHHIS
jgi:SpoVK/Ycf46/Vps4 family AAA+-type ATPase